MRHTTPVTPDAIKKELDLPCLHHVPVEGKLWKPCHCYHVETNLLQILFNTNLPSELKTAIINIITKYYPGYEDRASQKR